MGMFFSLGASGITMGVVYAMLAVGIILLTRSTGIANLAQGDLLALGAYTSYFLIMRLDLSGLPMILSMIILFVLFGAIFFFTCYYPMRNHKWRLTILICTVGAGMVIQELSMLVCGSQIRIMAPIIRGSLRIGTFRLQYQYIVIFTVSVLVLLGTYLLFDKMYVGRAIQAAAQNKYAANLIGIPPILTTLAVYIIVMVIAGIAGYLVAPIFIVRPTLNQLQTKAFAGMVLGGVGSVKGAVIGCLLIGFIESYSTYITTVYKDVFVFGILLLTLAIRPTGIFGQQARIVEKA